MNRLDRLSFFILSAAFMFGAGASGLYADDNVLLLHSFDTGYRWTDDITSGVKETLAASGHDTRLFIEYMDTQFFPASDVLPHLYSLYKSKYKNVHFSAILAADNTALEFMKSYGGELFPDVPVVFLGVNNFGPGNIAGMLHVTGVTEHPDYAGTIRLILDLQPSLRYIAVLSDSTVSGEQNYLQVRSVESDFSDRITFIYLRRLTDENLARALSYLPANTAILYLSLFRIEDGSKFTLEEGINFIKERTSAPIYTCKDALLGSGVVGGLMVSGKRQGQEAARMVIDILDGRAPEEIPVQTGSPNIYMFDYRELRKAGIPVSSLPENSTVINQPQSVYYQYRDLFWVVVAAFLLLISLIAGLVVNIYHRRRVERKLVASRAQYRVLTDHATDIIARFTFDGTCLYISPSVTTHLGFQPSEIEGTNFRDWVHPDDISALEAEAYEGGLLPQTFTTRSRVRDAHGNYLWFEATHKSVPHPESGKTAEIISVLRDVTKRREIEERLVAAKREAESSSLAKSEFLANMSHEIRTPLNAIIGFSELLAATEGALMHQDYVETIKNAGTSLLELINDILDLSKLDAGRVEIHKEPADVSRLLDTVYKMFEPKASSKGLSMSLSVGTDMPEWLEIDTARLRQVLVNLIGNAVKFTSHGSVRVRAECEWRNDRTLDLIISVSDTGIGIPEDKQEYIFQAFGQQDASIGRAYGGTGLGLAISRRLAEQMNGHITVKSTLGQGSTFSVVLQAVHPTDPVVDHQELGGKDLSVYRSTFTGQKALIVDDVESNRQILAEWLRFAGMECAEASNGLAALEAVQSERPAVIVLDLRMPVMDGVAAARRLRANPVTAHIPIMILTASVRSDEDLLVEQGFADVFLRKPVRPADFLATIAHLITGARATWKHPQQSTRESGTPPYSGGAAPERERPEKSPVPLELARIVDTELREQWKRVTRVKMFPEIEAFASRVEEVADMFGQPSLGNYARQLRAAVRQFDVERVNRLIAEFESHARALLPGEKEGSS